MTLADDLKKDVADFFYYTWAERNGTTVPEQDNLRLANDAVNINATVLYADIADSTVLVDTKANWFAAEVYKAFLHCAAKIIKSNDGQITAYDGDRVMAVYIGNYKNTNAALTALQINYACKKIINPAIVHKYGEGVYTLNHVVGVDTSPLFVARTGVRGANDLVWIGRAGNHAAKMAALPHAYSSYITGEVYDSMANKSKFGGTENKDMWEKTTWGQMGGRTVYRSNWTWAV